MKIWRFFVKNSISEKEFVMSDAALIHRIKNILRLTQGEKLVLFNNSGYD